MLRAVSKVIVLLFVVEVNGLDKILRGQSMLYGLASLTENGSRNTTCLKQLHELFEAVDLKRFWALKVLDASGQPGSGFLWGNNLWLGSHFQCTDVSNKKPFEINYSKVKRPEPTAYDFPPYPLEFVMAYMHHNSTRQQHTQMPLENMIELGLCVPQACSTKELEGLLNTSLDKRYLNIQEFYELDIKIVELKILKSEAWLSSPTTILTLSIFFITLVLVIAGTIYDVNITQPKLKAKQNVLDRNGKYQSRITTIAGVKVNGKDEALEINHSNIKYSGFGQIIQCFSIYSNIKSLVKTDVHSDAIGSVHGMRLFSILWVISVHAVYYQIDYLNNVPTGFRLSESFVVQILGNSTYCVDSFLFLSGFLISYTFYKAKKESLDDKKPVNFAVKTLEIITMFTHRYLRLTPVYVVTMLVSEILFSYYRQTTSLYPTEQPDINCPKYWWRNLLYINNFYPRSEMCLSWSWYLSADTQFFLVAAILLVVSTVSLRTATALLFSCIVLCMTITGFSSYAIGYIPTMDEQFIYLDAIYDFPWNRIGPYLIGVITGYILLVKLKEKMSLKKPYLVLMWIVFPMINLWILFGLYGRQISVEFSAVYMGISRTLWGFGLGWLFIACCTGNAGIVNKFLSFRGWIPLSRLTYCSYLLNPLIIHLIFLGTENAQSSSMASFTLSIFGTALITFYMAFWYSLLFESPYILLTKMLFKKLIARRKTTNNNPA